MLESASKISRFLTGAVIVAAIALAGAPASAQIRDLAAEARRNVGDDASAVCAGCTWQRNASGWVAEKPQPVSQVLTSAPEPPAGCDNVNAYERPDEALACALAQLERLPRVALPTFAVGQRYTHVYGDAMIVLSVGRALEGRTIVTGQRVTGPTTGAVFAFFVDAEGGLWR